MRHQISVQRDGRTYQVRAVQRGRPLRGTALTGGLEMLLLAPLVFACFGCRGRRDRYKVGVLLMPAGTLNLGRQVIYKENLASGGDLRGRVDQLLDDVRAGRFDNASRWRLRALR